MPTPRSRVRGQEQHCPSAEHTRDGWLDGQGSSHMAAATGLPCPMLLSRSWPHGSVGTALKASGVGCSSSGAVATVCERPLFGQLADACAARRGKALPSPPSPDPGSRHRHTLPPLPSLPPPAPSPSPHTYLPAGVDVSACVCVCLHVWGWGTGGLLWGGGRGTRRTEEAVGVGIWGFFHQGS